MSDNVLHLLQAEIPPAKVLELVGAQLEKSVNLPTWRCNGLSLLHLAVDVGRGKLVKMLMERGCDVNALDSSHWTPLTHACREGRLDIIKALVKQGAHLFFVEPDDHTSLEVAAQYGHLGITFYILDHALEQGTMDWWSAGLRIVHLRAIENDHLHIIKGLYDKRGVRMQNPDFRRSALMTAVRLQRTAIARYLLMDLEWDPKGLADPYQQQCKNGKEAYLTGLLYAAAVWSRDLEIVVLLIWKGVDVNAQDSRGLTPLEYYMDMHPNKAGLALLRHCGAALQKVSWARVEELEALRREAEGVQVHGCPAASPLPVAAGLTSCATTEYFPAIHWTVTYKAAVNELRQLVRGHIKASCRDPQDFGPLLCAVRRHYETVVSQEAVERIVHLFYTFRKSPRSQQGGAKAGHAPFSLYPPFQCQLSKAFTVVKDPVVAADRCVYERAAIKAWIEECLTEDGVIVSPVTGAVMSTVLLPHRPSPCTKAAA